MGVWGLLSDDSGDVALLDEAEEAVELTYEAKFAGWKRGRLDSVGGACLDGRGVGRRVEVFAAMAR